MRGRNINISGVLHQTVVDALDQTWMNVMKQRQMPIRPMQLLATLLTNSDIEMVLARLGLPFDALANALSRQLAYYPPVKTDDSLDDSVQAIMLNAYLIAERARSARVRVTDVRADTIRFGFGVYQDEADVAELIGRCAKALT